VRSPCPKALDVKSSTRMTSNDEIIRW
jgi:hypothetical protein